MEFGLQTTRISAACVRAKTSTSNGVFSELLESHSKSMLKFENSRLLISNRDLFAVDCEFSNIVNNVCLNRTHSFAPAERRLGASGTAGWLVNAVRRLSETLSAVTACGKRLAAYSLLYTAYTHHRSLIGDKHLPDCILIEHFAECHSQQMIR